MGLFRLFHKKREEPDVAAVRTAYEPQASAFSQDTNQPLVNQDLNPFTQPAAFQQGYNKDNDLVISKLELISARLENINRRLESIERFLAQQAPQNTPSSPLQAQRRW